MSIVKVGLVGLNLIGGIHAENIRRMSDKAQLVSIVSKNHKKAKEFQRKHHVTHIYTEFDDMLNNEELDAVIIASSVKMHCSQIVSACEAGLHVFCEKPVVMDENELNIVESAVTKNQNKIFTIGFMRRLDPSYIEAKKKINAGEIGTPLFFRGYSLDPIIDGRFLIERAERNCSWFLEMAVHDIDLARWFLNSEVERVYATGGSYIYESFKEKNEYDNGFILMKFVNGSCAFLYPSCTSTHGCHVESEIVGTDGVIRIGAVPRKNAIQVFDNKGVIEECITVFPERWKEAFYTEIREFVECIIDKRSPSISFYDGKMSTQVALIIQQSIEADQLIAINQSD